MIKLDAVEFAFIPDDGKYNPYTVYINKKDIQKIFLFSKDKDGNGLPEYYEIYMSYGARFQVLADIDLLEILTNEEVI